MLHTSELDMSDSISDKDVSLFIADASWTIQSTQYTVLKASPGSAIFGRDISFDIPFVVDWTKIGNYR